MIHIDSYWGEPDYNDENSYGYYTSNIIGEDRASYVVNKKCKYCGKTGLEWIKTARGWRLGEYSGAIHNCLDKPFKPKENIKGEAMKNHKEILENLLSELDSIETIGLYWDRNWQQIREQIIIQNIKEI